MSTTQERFKIKIINVIVQARVREGRCIDCGQELTKRPGYCLNRVCGQAKNPTTYTKVEYSIAKGKYSKIAK